jgi:type II secretory pathway pseudopilin PulG
MLKSLKELNQPRAKNEGGFIYLDVIIAIVIMMIGVTALAAAMTAAVVQAASSRRQQLARQYAQATMEAIISAREINSFNNYGGWDAIGNVGSNCSSGTCLGIFPTGWQPVRTQAGADGIYGTGDDTGYIVPGYQRQIIITDLCDPDRPSYNCPGGGSYPVMFRQITVNVQYQLRNMTAQESISTILTNY